MKKDPYDYYIERLKFEAYGEGPYFEYPPAVSMSKTVIYPDSTKPQVLSWPYKDTLLGGYFGGWKEVGETLVHSSGVSICNI